MIDAKPWTHKEKLEIAALREKGWDESRIYGWMKLGNNRRGTAPPLKERKEMATKKKTGTKASKKKTTASRKTGDKPGRKAGGFQVGEKLVAVKGMEDKFYKKFPRFAAYQLLLKKGVKGMKTADFVDAVEKLDGVKTRGQALGILTKLLKKGCAKASGKVSKA